MNNISGYDSIINDSWTTLYQSNHHAIAYRHRATQLTNWKRLRDFISLGVAPGLLSATTVWDNSTLRNILILIAGICSISSWLWFIFGFAYSWDNQLKTSINVPLKLKLIIPEIKKEIEIFTNAKDQNMPQLMKQSINKLKELTSQAKALDENIVEEQVHVKPWMNVIAQQDTMRNYDWKCGGCLQKWIPGSSIFNSDKAKKFIKDVKKDNLKDICQHCGQKLPDN